MNSGLTTVDLVVLGVYVTAVVALGCYFVRDSRTTGGFMTANGALSGWTVGISTLGTVLSSITFLSYPADAYKGNWNSAVSFLLMLPTTWIVARYIVPFCRNTPDVSAYAYFETRFGPWARNYAAAVFVITQIGRIGTVMYLVSVAMNTLLGWNTHLIIVTMGIVVTVYTLLGGIEAVIWTDVLQSIVLVAGGLLCLGLLMFGMPEGPAQIWDIAQNHNKFAVGEFSLSLSTNTFLVMVIYGAARDLANSAIDQNRVQRYKAVKSTADAQLSAWVFTATYVPLAALFFFMGTALFAYYEAQPDLLPAELRLSEKGEQVFPYFIVSQLPVGVRGLLIAAILSAAMSTVDSSLNSSASLVLTDFHRRWFHKTADERESMRVLHGATLVLGVLGSATAIGLTYTQQGVLQTWWAFEAVLGGALFGLFLLSVLARRATSFTAATAVTIGSLLALWVAFSPYLPDRYAAWKSPLHGLLSVLVGTMSIFLLGVLLSAGRRSAADAGG